MKTAKAAMQEAVRLIDEAALNDPQPTRMAVAIARACIDDARNILALQLNHQSWAPCSTEGIRLDGDA